MNDNDAKVFWELISAKIEKKFKEQSDIHSSIYACLAVVTDVDVSGIVTVRLLSSPDDGSQDFIARNHSGSVLEVGDSVWLHYWGDYTNAYIAVRNMGDTSADISATGIGALSFAETQILTAEQKTQALSNAGAAPSIHASQHLVGGSDPIPYPINLVINPIFNVNQDSKSGTVTLTAGNYGHDGWKAGASGCTYTFSTSENVTTVTISSGSLLQVIEGINLESGTVCLSWAGTAHGKIGAGSYSDSGVTGTVTGGTNFNIEFNSGTLSKVQLNYGNVALPFVPRDYIVDLRLCQRYYIPTAGRLCAGYVNGSTELIVFQPTPVRMRANPTPTLVTGDNAIFNNIIRSITAVVSAILDGSCGVRIVLTLSSAASGAYPAISVNSVIKLDARL